MSEKLDLVSMCHRAPVDTNFKGDYICDQCGEVCLAVRPDRSPPPFDPERKVWVRKGIKVEPGPAVPLEGFTEFRKEHGKDLPV